MGLRRQRYRDIERFSFGAASLDGTVGGVAVNMDLDGGPGADDARGDNADTGSADMVDDGGELGIAFGQERGFSFGADRFFGEVMISRGHDGEIGWKAGEL